MAAWTGVRLECIKELGYALVCMDYLHSDVDWGKQKGRVRTLCRELAHRFSNEDPAYWDDLKRRIDNEIENLC